jgi:hypothetical protein
VSAERWASASTRRTASSIHARCSEVNCGMAAC